jgi:GNAT superfamily N-acetyltransferase
MSNPVKETLLSSAMCDLCIRPAVVDDCALLLCMIKELAAFEQLQHCVVATEEDLRHSLFRPHPHAHALIASVDDAVIGFVIYFHNFSTFLGRYGLYIEDLYIREAYRSRGYGEKLIRAVCQQAALENCGRVEWWVLDWNERAIQFYKKIGAVPMSDWTVFRLTEEAYNKLVP